MSQRQNSPIEIKNAINDSQAQTANLTALLYNMLMQKDQQIENMRTEIEKLKTPPKK